MKAQVPLGSTPKWSSESKALESPREGRHLGLTPGFLLRGPGVASKSTCILNQEPKTTLEIQCLSAHHPGLKLEGLRITPVTVLLNRGGDGRVKQAEGVRYTVTEGDQTLGGEDSMEYMDVVL